MPDYDPKRPCEKCDSLRAALIDWVIVIVVAAGFVWYVTKGAVDAGYPG